MKKLLPVLVVGIALLAPAAGLAQAAAYGRDAAVVESWKRKLVAAKAELDKWRAEKIAAERAVAKMRSARYPRGEEAAEIELRLHTAQTRLTEAEATLPSLVEEARRAGIPPGILRPYWASGGDVP